MGGIARRGLLTALLLLAPVAHAAPPGADPTSLEDAEDRDDDAPRDPILGPCVPGSEAFRQAEARLTDVIRAYRALGSGGILKDFQEALLDLRIDACLRWPTQGWDGLDEADVLQVREWWTAGGERWLRSFLAYDPARRKVLIAPEVRRRIDPELRRFLAKSLCDPKRSTCEPGETWRARATRALQAADSTCRVPWSACEASLDQLGKEFPFRGRPYAEWIHCSEERLGRTVELPLDLVNPPSDGWLVVRDRRGKGESAKCHVAAAYALATGDAWQIDTCGKVQTRVGRVPVIPLRELALLLVHEDALDLDIRARAVELDLPLGLEPSWPESLVGSFFGSIGCSVGGVRGFFPRISWRVSIDGRERLGDLLTEECEPLARVADQWLRALDRQWVKACPTADVPARLVARPDRRPPESWEPKDREQKTYEALGALMRKVPEGCPVVPSSDRQ